VKAKIIPAGERELRKKKIRTARCAETLHDRAHHRPTTAPTAATSAPGKIGGPPPAVGKRK